MAIASPSNKRLFPMLKGVEIMQIIAKSLVEKSRANLKDYASVCQSFSWPAAESDLMSLHQYGGLNMAFEAVDRHALFSQGAGKIALRWCSKSALIRDYTYQNLYELSNRFANVLAQLGLQKGDSVFALSGRVPELYIGALGTLKHRCVFSPLFAAFGPEPIQVRMQMGKAKVLLTSEALYKRKVAAIRARLPDLQYVLIMDEIKDKSLGDDPFVLSLAELMEKQSSHYTIEPTDPEDPALFHFTSGTTGQPKGAIHVHEAIVSHYVTGRYALDLHEDDVFWCTADPGWVTGTSYGILSPLSHGVTVIVDEGEFDAERWCQILQEQKVTVWYTAPTAIRMMMKSGDAFIDKYDWSSLRFIASVGEPLNPEAVKWGVKVFQKPIHDNWWQTETGGIMIANYLSMDIRPGSMGKPIPGIQAKIVRREGQAILDVALGEQGELAIKTPWPSMFRGYLGQDERYRQSFIDGWYMTGDLARVDQDGYFWFIGRSDDVIKSAGHLIGPFEVESALLEHPAVAEAAVIGRPDPLLMEVIKAFVTLKEGYESHENLRLDILGFARSRLGPAVAPRELEICASLPKTRSGKIMRRLLKAREMGWPEGDTSTLENDPALAKKGDI
jgi:acetyl-CoA synthetase